MTMRKLALVALCLVSLAGCATTSLYGNFATAPATLNKAMADDTVTQLVALFPPAQTRLNLKQPATDAYGASLVASLREKGYSIAEYVPAPVTATQAASAPAAASSVVPTPTPPTATPGVDLRYVVDAPASTDLYRVTVMIGSQSISRAYVTQQNGSLAPAGSWARKE